MRLLSVPQIRYWGEALSSHRRLRFFFFLLFSVIFVVSSTDNFFFSIYDFFKQECSKYFYFLLHHYCKVVVTVVFSFFDVCRAVQYDMIYVFFLVQFSTSHTVSFFVFVSISVLLCKVLLKMVYCRKCPLLELYPCIVCISIVSFCFRFCVSIVRYPKLRLSVLCLIWIVFHQQ